MRTPGFTAEACLPAPRPAPQTVTYSFDEEFGAEIETANPCVAACVTLAITMQGLDKAITPDKWTIWTVFCAEMCGVAYTAALEETVGGLLLAGGGTAAAEGFTIATLPGLALAGLIGIPLGAGIGLGVEHVLTPDESSSTPQNPNPQLRCGVARGNPVTGTITRCYWGSRRSISSTVRDAENICKSLTNYCTGTCANGKACTPTAAAIPRPNQSWCWTGAVPGRATTVDYTCVCSC